MQLILKANSTPEELLRYGPYVLGTVSNGDSEISGYFLIDTGADAMVLCDAVAKRLNLAPQCTIDARAMAGPAKFNLYKARLKLQVYTVSDAPITLDLCPEFMGSPDYSTQHKAPAGEAIGMIGRWLISRGTLEMEGESGRCRVLFDSRRLMTPD